MEMRSKTGLFGAAACLLAILTACEKPEEALTPPAAMQNSSQQRTAAPAATEKATQSAQDDSFALPGDEHLAHSPVHELEFSEGGVEPAPLPDEPPGEEPGEPAVVEPVALFPPELLARASAHICFFSFNTGAEYVQLKRMVNQLNKASNVSLTITEYQLMDSDPYDNFVDLLKSGKQCDGIVLSGHHTDEFYGERTDGDLEIEDLEELACEPRFAPWFANIKALWLQGCNTVKAGVSNTDLDEDELITGSPIDHMQRLLDPSDMEESIDDMRDLLYDNTNEENLVNDYMRVFSGATVFGWSNIAPGEQAGAQKSIPYHLAQVTRLVDSDQKYFQNPLQTRIPPVAAERYSEVLYGLLKRPNRPGQAFPEKLTENTFMQGWRDHGNVRYRYSFDNHDIEAFPALGNSSNEILKQLKGLTCLMHQLDDRLDDMSMMQVADYILRDRSLTTYNTYLLWAMLRSLPKNSDAYQQLHQRMVSDDHLVSELRFNATKSGFSKKDADSFLATLGPKPVIAKTEPAARKTVKAEADKKAAAKPDTPANTPTGSHTASESDSAPEQTKPWYLNEPTDSAAADNEKVFEF